MFLLSIIFLLDCIHYRETYLIQFECKKKIIQIIPQKSFWKMTSF